MNLYPNNEFGENFRLPGPPIFSPPTHVSPPNFGFPSNMGQPPNFGPPPNMGQPPAGQMPMSAPPGFLPPMPAWRVGSSGIQSCLFRNTYIWMNNGRGFWFFPTAVGREFVAGFRWSSRYGWRFRTITRDSIRSFECFR